MRNVMHVMAGVLLLAGCASGRHHEVPEYGIPEAHMPAHFTAATEDGSAQDDRHFWAGFEDPLLEQLLARTLEANHDLQGALARYDSAAALLYGARREQWPSVTASAAVSEQHLAAVEQMPGGDSRVTRYQAGLAASWELDLAGRLRSASRARRADLDAAGADIAALQVALAGEVASTYFTLRGLQQQHDVAQQNVALQRATLEIVEARVAAGRGTDFDVVRARSQLERTRAALPSLEAAIRAHMHRLAVLTGAPPATLIDSLAMAGPLPEQRPVIPVDTPGEVLRRRPDIAAAERRLAAATARIGVASADLFPRFTLSGLLGSVASDGSDLFSGAAESRRVALGVDWTFLDHGRVRARIEAADADSRVALAQYQQAVLQALEETETRLVNYQQAQVRAERLHQAATDAERAAELARTRYERGFIGYFEVLAAEQELSETRDAAVRSRTEVTLAMVDLYRALAGAPSVGFEDQIEG